MQALVLEQSDGLTHAQIREIDAEQLPAGDVTVDISWSGINYKDALAITGKGKIIRNFPMVPGIDFVGTVRHSDSDRFTVGQPVILTGWGVGENHWGGLAQQARVKSDWLVPLPASLDARNAMILGTAGFTAMLCVMALEDGGITPESGDIIVTGASGGVGSTAVALLAELGYQVTAVSGRADNTEYLKKLGAKQVLDRSEFTESPRPLEKQRWAGAVDTVGDNVLATLLAQMDYNATVAACGLAGGIALPTTVMPFILRNVRLQGVDSVMAPLARRQQAWDRLAAILPESFYQQVTQEIGLEDVPAVAAALLDNKVTGRTLVKIS
ncbi:MDR family oxidoreductase [Pectobacterium atrosepticum]|uniref:acrylyl-CoA reductase (NADPH) n=1 Tax=Pectobacterium atrosepticum TaxID=29471 RepID=UPI0003A1AB6F|nr:MDR family oxidoreductase [Pectobacterium atrosepticum]GKV86058.1 quinone oxidoreductase [Pectobacterium carotovorum subsp. carotovorum]AIA69286.1 quinone oxidoreductase [Pectobacterium atrosepticum]AIK12192.1 putative zinc-binding oxidoreductase [Pectobacterium atrosepticum]ATY89137.1 oxidoreductase [Pectobacterium atrosepticum]KFX15866.1 quinone oxidoreductase [Pectobacterium atrosepticum]